MNAVAIERPTRTLDTIAEATRLPTSAIEQFLYWVNADADGWVERLTEAGLCRAIGDTFDDYLVGVTADLMHQEEGWPVARLDQTRWVIATIVRQPGWSDCHL